MPQINQLNTWGSSGSDLEPQRSDLWQLDLSLAISDLKAALNRASGDRASSVLSQFPSASDLPYYARQVDFPADKTTTRNVRRDNSTFADPGYDDPPGMLIVNFIHEIPLTLRDGSYVGYNGSTIFAVMEAWRAYARAGQQLSPNNSSLSLSLNDAADPGTLRVKYKWPVDIYLLSPQPTTDSVSGFTLGVSATYRAINAWPSEVQLNQLSHTNPQLWEFRVSFAVDGVQAK